MLESSRQSSDEIGLYLTPEHRCGYFPERIAQTLFLDPLARPDHGLFGRLLGLGFRRSGDHIYRPRCPGCRACVPIRIRVQEFQPARRHSRCWRNNNESVSVRIKPPVFEAEHHALYLAYTSHRHPEGGMAEADEQHYMEFLTTHWCHCHFVEFRHRGRLMAIAVTDQLLNGLSAVYTFFDPELSAHSPGVFAILWQIEEARRRGLEHLYLGYWIRESQKMNYKEGYRPLEAWDGQRWRRFGPGEELPDFNRGL